MTPHAAEMRYLNKLTRHAKTWAKNRERGLAMRQRTLQREAFRAQLRHAAAAFILALGLGLVGHLGRVAMAGVLG